MLLAYIWAPTPHLLLFKRRSFCKGMMFFLNQSESYFRFFLLQILQLNTLFLALLSVTTPMALRALFGPLPFSVAFLGIEAFKVFNIIKAIISIRFIMDKVIKVILSVEISRWPTRCMPPLPTSPLLSSFSSSSTSG